MGAKKGSNHFKSYQQARVQKKLDEIDRFIHSLPEKMKFERFEDLVAECCKHLGCHRTTIYRQQAYIDRLREDFQLRNPDLMSVSPQHSSPAQIDQSIKARDAKIASLLGNLERSKKDLQEANAKIGYYESEEYRNMLIVPSVPNLSDNAPEKEANTDKMAFEYTAYALDTLLTYLDKNNFGIGLRKDTNSSKVTLSDDGIAGIAKQIVEHKYLLPFVKFRDKAGKKHE